MPGSPIPLTTRSPTRPSPPRKVLHRGRRLGCRASPVLVMPRAFRRQLPAVIAAVAPGLDLVEHLAQLLALPQVGVQLVQPARRADGRAGGGAGPAGQSCAGPARARPAQLPGNIRTL